MPFWKSASLNTNQAATEMFLRISVESILSNTPKGITHIVYKLLFRFTELNFRLFWVFCQTNLGIFGENHPEMIRILKFNLPPPLFDLITLSQRNIGVRLILPNPSNDFLYKGSKLWNIVAKTSSKNEDLFSIKIGAFKTKLKKCLLDIQNKFDSTEWCSYNFNLDTALKH